MNAIVQSSNSSLASSQNNQNISSFNNFNSNEYSDDVNSSSNGRINANSSNFESNILQMTQSPAANQSQSSTSSPQSSPNYTGRCWLSKH